MSNKETPPAKAPRKDNTKKTDEIISDDSEDEAPSADEIRLALRCLTRMMAQAGPEEQIPRDNIVIDYDIVLRVGGGSDPVRVTGTRELAQVFVMPDLADAPAEFATTMRQVLLPLTKTIQRETSERMESAGITPEGTAFKPLLPG